MTISGISLQKRQHIVHHALVEKLHAFRSHIGAVGRQDDLLTSTQGVTRRQGLDLKHVNSGAAQTSRRQGCRQGFFIHQGAPPDVDQDRSRLHPGQFSLADEDVETARSA